MVSAMAKNKAEKGLKRVVWGGRLQFQKEPRETPEEKNIILEFLFHFQVQQQTRHSGRENWQTGR